MAKLTTTADGLPLLTSTVEEEDIQAMAIFLGFQGALMRLNEAGLMTQDQRVELSERALEIAEQLAAGKVYDPFNDTFIGKETI